jgi:hypothetical protein
VGSLLREGPVPTARVTLDPRMTSGRDPLKSFPWSWDEILEHAASMDDYPVDLKRQLPEAIALLRRELAAR